MNLFLLKAVNFLGFTDGFVAILQEEGFDGGQNLAEQS